MEYPDNKPRRKRVQREEIGGQMLTDSIIGEIDRLDAIGEQAGRTAEKYRQIFDDLKGYELRVDTAALDAKEKEFATALEKQVKQIRAATRTVRAALWLMIVVLFLVFAVGYCYLDTHPWKAKYFQLEQQYNQLQQEMQKLTVKKPAKKKK
ncbi:MULTISPECIES: hypothetical protein [Alistipes]|jgi:hypothetical protein|uniref:hypothetical protein n=3 Tax=Rikenellaceae TaxID=171550 RepID=UPI001E0C7E64|nr:hypothetical protein [Alistipes sp.]MBS6100089.1 hypothetical protein [Alistipes sp.]HJI19308.1 hypothetical protein [Rikenellaceae bacterium]